MGFWLGHRPLVGRPVRAFGLRPAAPPAVVSAGLPPPPPKMLFSFQPQPSTPPLYLADVLPPPALLPRCPPGAVPGFSREPLRPLRVLSPSSSPHAFRFEPEPVFPPAVLRPGVCYLPDEAPPPWPAPVPAPAPPPCCPARTGLTPVMPGALLGRCREVGIVSQHAARNIIRVLVFYLRTALQLLHSISITQCIKCVLHRRSRGRYGGDHHRSAVLAHKRVLEHLR